MEVYFSESHNSERLVLDANTISKIAKQHKEIANPNLEDKIAIKIHE